MNPQGQMDDPQRDLYRAIVTRVSIVAAAHDDLLHTAVPACPDWTVRDVLGHLAGIAGDWLAGRLDGYASDAWTRAQVERHAADDLDTLLAGWNLVVVALEDVPAHEPMGAPWRWLFGDALAHEADLYEALGTGDVPPIKAIAAGLVSIIPRWRQVVGGADVPPLCVHVDGVREWWIGASSDASIHLYADAYELLRALYGRRPRSVVEQMDWSGDPSPYLDLGLPFPFSFPLGT